MNSMELSCAAGVAIFEWHTHHNVACILSILDGKVICEKPHTTKFQRNNPLYISKFELSRGLTSSRWDSVGTALHNLYCKELECQSHQKH